MPSINIPTGITLHYQDKGKKSNPTVILIIGLGAQMTIWPDEFYFGLVEKGFRVVRFDNRDVGLSSKLHKYGKPSLIKSWLSTRFPVTSNAPYTLEDMADDVLALMSALKIKKAHLVGASMGGMIAQILAAKHKKKVLSLTSIMSSPSLPALSKKGVSAMLKLAKRPNSADREATIRYYIKMNKIIGSPLFPSNQSLLREQAIITMERGYYPEGFKRQLVAMTASGCRRKLIKKIKAPTLVIHGEDDPLIPVSGGMETAEKIKKAKLKVVEGMGHDFPIALMPKWIKWMTKHIEKAETKRIKKKFKSHTNASPDRYSNTQ